MNRHFPLCFLALASLALSACGSLRPPSAPGPVVSSRIASPPAVPPRAAPSAAPSPVNQEAEQVSELIAYSQKMAAARHEEQKRELGSVTQAFARDAGAHARVKLALLLAIPGSGFTDEARAVTLLEPLAAGQPAGPLRQFALLLHTQVGERMREQRRSAQLREQLDALKAMERSLIERGQPGKK